MFFFVSVHHGRIDLGCRVTAAQINGVTALPWKETQASIGGTILAFKPGSYNTIIASSPWERARLAGITTWEVQGGMALAVALRRDGCVFQKR